RNYVREVVEVGVDIQREAMRGDPAPGVDSHGANLAFLAFWAHPDTGTVLNPPRFDAEVRQGLDYNLLQGSQVAAKVGKDALQVENRIHDELAGSMEGDVPAAVYCDCFGANPFECSRVNQEVCEIGALAEGIDGRMF